MKEVDKAEAVAITLETMKEITKQVEIEGKGKLVMEMKVLQFVTIALAAVPNAGVLTTFLLKFIVFSFGDQQLGINLAEATLNTIDKLMEGLKNIG